MQHSARSSLAAGMGLQGVLGTVPGAAAGAASQQQQQQHLGYGQDEHAHMLTAIRQPLFIQTPLQVMLETLVEKLQLQAGVISGMQDKLAVLERNKLTGSEFLSRIQLLESRVDAATAIASGTCTSGDSDGCASSSAGSGGASGPGAFSPFAQAKMAKQLAALEQQSAGLQATSAQLTFRSEQVLLPRLQQCEQRLAGVSNLAGSVMAVDLMAAELGISVPHPPLSALSQQDGMSSALLQQELQQPQQQPEHIPLLQTLHQQQQHQQQQQQPGGIQVQQQGGVLTISRQQQLQQQIDTGKEQMAEVQQQLQQRQPRKCFGALERAGECVYTRVGAYVCIVRIMGRCYYFEIEI